VKVLLLALVVSATIGRILVGGRNDAARLNTVIESFDDANNWSNPDPGFSFNGIDSFVRDFAYSPELRVYVLCGGSVVGNSTSFFAVSSVEDGGSIPLAWSNVGANVTTIFTQCTSVCWG
jgi:hypothetical protein